MSFQIVTQIQERLKFFFLMVGGLIGVVVGIVLLLHSTTNSLGELIFIVSGVVFGEGYLQLTFNPDSPRFKRMEALFREIHKREKL